MSYDAGTVAGKMMMDVSGYTGPLNTALASTRTIADYAKSDLPKAMTAGERSLATVGTALRAATGHAGGFSTSMKGIVASAGSAIPTLGTLAATATGVGAALAGVGAVKFLGGFIADSVRMAAAHEDLAVSFKVMLGSAEAAKSLMGDIKQFAAATPFESDEITAAARSLIAYGSTAGGVISELRSLGDVASGVGMRLGDLAQIYGKLRTSGRAEMEDINQLAGRGIPIIKALASQMRIAESDVRGYVSTGKVGFNEVAAALNSMSAEGGLFFKMMEERSATLNGKLSTLSDAWKEVKLGIGEATAEGLGLNGTIDETAAAIEDLREPAVAAARAVAEATRAIGPTLTFAVEEASRLVQVMTQFEKFKPGQSPYAMPDSSPAIANVPADAAGVDKLRNVWNVLQQARREVFTEAMASTKDPGVDTALRVNAPGLATTIDKQTSDAEALNAQLRDAEQKLASLQAAADKGQSINAADFASVSVAIQAMEKNARELRESQLRKLAAVTSSTLVGDEMKRLMQESSDAARSYFGELDKQLAAYKPKAPTPGTPDGTEADFFMKEKKTAGPTPATPTTGTTPGVAGSTTAVTTGKAGSAEAEQGKIAQLWEQAEAARLRTKGRMADAEDLEWRGAWARRLAAARSEDERRALTVLKEEEAAERVGKRKTALEERTAREQREIADNLAETRLTRLRTVGQAEQAEREALQRKWREQIDAATDEEVRFSLIKRRNAELEALAVEQSERRKKAAREEGNPAPESQPVPVGELKTRIEKSQTQPERALNRLNLRESLNGGLTPEEEIRRERIRERMSAPGRRGAGSSSFVPPVEREPGERSIANAVGASLRRPSKREEMPDVGPSIGNAIASRLGPRRRRAGGQDGEDDGRQGGGRGIGPINVTAPTNAREIIDGVTSAVMPVVDSAVRHGMAELRGEVAAWFYKRNAAGNL